MSKIKRILSTLLVVTMFLSCMPLTTFAMLVGGTKAAIELVAMEADAEAKFGYKVVEPSDLSLSTATTGTQFFIGIRLTNFNQISEIASGIGITRLDIAFTFNTNYIAPVRTGNNFGTYIEKCLTLEMEDPQDSESTVEYIHAYHADGYTYEYDCSLQEGDKTQGDTNISGTNNVAYIVLNWQGLDDGLSPLFVPTADEMFAIIPFKFTAAPPAASTTGTWLFDFSKDKTINGALDLGPSSNIVSYQNTGNGALTDINTVIDFKTSGVNFFPAAPAAPTAWTLTGALTNTTQYVGAAPDTTNSIAGTYTVDGDTEAVDPATDIEWYYVAEGTTISAASALTQKLSELTDGKWQTAGDYDIYAVSKDNNTLFYKAGTVTVSAVEINDITGITGLPAEAVDGQTIDTSGINVTVTYNNGQSTDTTLSLASLVSKGYTLYRVTDPSGTPSYAEVTGTMTYDGSSATNSFIVAKKVDATTPGTPALATPVSVTVNYNSLTVTKHTAPKLGYNANDPLDLSALRVTVKQAKNADADADPLAYSGFDAYEGDKYKLAVVIAADEATAKTASEVNDGDTIQASDIGKQIWVVYENNGVKSAVSMGTIGAKTITKVALPAIGSTGSTPGSVPYGTKLTDAFPDTAKFKVYYDGSTSDYTEMTLSQLIAAGVTLKIGNDVLADSSSTLSDVIMERADGATIDCYVNGGKLDGSSVNIAVTKKELTVTLSKHSIVKGYDGGETVSDDLMQISTGDLVDADDIVLAGKVKVGGVTFEYENKNVGQNKQIKYKEGLPVAVADADNSGTAADAENFNDLYTLKLGAEFPAAGSAFATANLSGEITQKALTLNFDNLTGVPPVFINAEESERKGESGQQNVGNFVGLATGFVSGDDVTFEYEWTYSAAAVGTASSTSGDKDVTIKVLSYDGEDAGNYAIRPAVGNESVHNIGTVNNKNVTAIRLDTTNVKVNYEYPDRTFNLDNLKVYVTYDSVAGETEMNLNEFITALGTVALKNGNTGLGDHTYSDPLPYGELTVALALGTDPDAAKEFTINVKRKTIAVDDIDWTVVKDYDGDTTVTGTEGSGDVSALVNGDDVGVTAKYEYTDKNAGTGNKTVNITGITLTGGAKDNYVLDKTSTSISDGTINQATQAAPAAPTYDAAVLKSTNGITVTAPVGTSAAGTKYLYSINGTDWQESPVFTGLNRNTTYEVKVKLEGDTNHKESDPSVAASIKTYKYKVDVLQTGSGSPITTVYTDDITTGIDSDATVNSVLLGSAPANFVAYFSDLAGGTAQTYPLVADANDDVTLYMQAAANRRPASGGGGGGSVTYKVTYVVGENGAFAEDSQTIESVKSGAAPDEAPTVTAKEGWEFVGWSIDGGETVVDLDTLKITKAVTLTAVYKEVEEKEPIEIVDGPIIDEQYTKPYATGYKDGSFAPNNQLTRAEMAAMIARLSYGDELPDGVYDATFADVSADAWYNKYIGYLESKGVMTGYKDGTFQPERPISRGEFAAVIARGQQYELTPVYGMFTDIEFDWAQDYITTLATLGVVTGYEDGTFMPLANLTRAEAVTMINRVLEDSVAVVTFTPNDIAGHWAEAEVILAVNERKLVSAE